MQHQPETDFDPSLSLLLVGTFPQAFTEYLQWKNTWPLSSCLEVYHYQPNHWPANDSHTALMSFLVLGNLEGIDFSRVLALLKIAKQQSTLLIIYASAPLLNVQQINNLSGYADNLILSQQVQWQMPFDMPVYRLQKQIHQSNDIIMINIIEALTQTLTNPEQGLICMDFADIKTILIDRNYGCIGSVIESGAGSEKRLVDSVLRCPMFMQRQAFSGIYAQIGFGDNGLSLDQYSEIGRYIEFSTLVNMETSLCLGARPNKYLLPDELQLTVLAATE